MPWLDISVLSYLPSAVIKRGVRENPTFIFIYRYSVRSFSQLETSIFMGDFPASHVWWHQWAQVVTFTTAMNALGHPGHWQVWSRTVVRGTFQHDEERQVIPQLGFAEDVFYLSQGKSTTCGIYKSIGNILYIYDYTYIYNYIYNYIYIFGRSFSKSKKIGQNQK